MSDRYTISLPVFDKCLSNTGVRKLLSDSDASEKQALEQFARYFKNEMHYDNIQYEANNHSDNCIGFLFTVSALDMCTEEQESMPTRCVGGCSFRKVQDTWVLCWIWIHPFFRKKRKLSGAWKGFCNEFGDFAIEAPLSSSMDSFVKKQSSTHKLVRIN